MGNKRRFYEAPTSSSTSHPPFIILIVMNCASSSTRRRLESPENSDETTSQYAYVLPWRSSCNYPFNLLLSNIKWYRSKLNICLLWCSVCASFIGWEADPTTKTNRRPLITFSKLSHCYCRTDGAISMHEATILDFDARIGLVNSGYSICVSLSNLVIHAAFELFGESRWAGCGHWQVP